MSLGGKEKPQRKKRKRRGGQQDPKALVADVHNPKIIETKVCKYILIYFGC